MAGPVMQATCYMGVPIKILLGNAHVLVSRGQEVYLGCSDSVGAASFNNGNGLAHSAQAYKYSAATAATRILTDQA